MQSFSYSSHRIDPAALKPLLTILAEDARALRAKTLALRNTAAKGFKNYNTTLHQVGSLVPGLFQPHSWAVPASFPGCSSLIPELFQPHSRAVPASFPSCSSLIPGLFQPHSRAVPASFPGCSCLIPGLFLPHSRAVPASSF